MANHLYVTGAKEAAENYFMTTTLKAMLVASGYVADKDDDVVDAGGANDPVDHEISGGSGYVGGWGGSGRKTLASKTVTANKANDRVDFDCADITWTAIATATQPANLLTIKEGGANDTTSRLHSKHDFVVTTNGGDITAQINDLWRLSV